MHCENSENQPSLTGSDTQAVILAAGLGSRLGGGSDGRPKCLLDVGGRTLIRHHLEVLNGLGVEDILIVVGHGAEQVMEEVRHAGVMKFNHRYSSTNSLYSLWLTRKWIARSMMVINGDVLADPQIYRQLLEENGNVLAFDSRSGTGEEEMKVRFESNRLLAINKDMDPDHSHGEHLGILKFDARGARALMDEADRLVEEGRVNDWAPAAVHCVAQRIPIKGIDVTALPWTEIDFPEDLEHARKRVWPAIDRRKSAAAAARSSVCDVPPQVVATKPTH